jgi:hypothetical protein
MKYRTHQSSVPAWIVDRNAARVRAIKWLGDRYLLEKPLNGSHSVRRGASGAHAPG